MLAAAQVFGGIGFFLGVTSPRGSRATSPGAAVILLALLRPDPLLARRDAAEETAAPAARWSSALKDLPSWPRLALIGVVVMAGSNVAMVAVWR